MALAVRLLAHLYLVLAAATATAALPVLILKDLHYVLAIGRLLLLHGNLDSEVNAHGPVEVVLEPRVKRQHDVARVDAFKATVSGPALLLVFRVPVKCVLSKAVVVLVDKADVEKERNRVREREIVGGVPHIRSD